MPQMPGELLLWYHYALRGDQPQSLFSVCCYLSTQPQDLIKGFWEALNGLWWIGEMRLRFLPYLENPFSVFEFLHAEMSAYRFWIQWLICSKS